MPYIDSAYVEEPLYVVCSVFNPAKFKARYQLYQEFAKRVKDAGAVLVTVEASLHERHHALSHGVTQHGVEIYQEAPTKPTEYHKAYTTNPHQYIKVRVESEIWLKENLLNIGMSYLPEDAKYIAWPDADVLPANPNWVKDTIQALQHFKVVQMFSHVLDLGPDHQPIQEHLGFVYCYDHDMPRPKSTGGYYYGYCKPPKKGPNLWHPGYAWAARREALDELGRLLDFAILGSGDNHMAHSLIGEGFKSVHPDMHPRYLERVLEWEWRANEYIRGNVGYMPGLLLHYWHGKKADRRYGDRWNILTKNQYNPDTDVKYDIQGALQLEDRGDDRSVKLRNGIMKYNRGRNEDSIDLK